MRSIKPPAVALWGLLTGLAIPVAHAEIVATGPSGFSLKIETTVAGSPADAYKRFIQIGQWWDPAHTYSGSGANLTLTVKPDGCFCERLPGGGFVKHMDVVYAAPGNTLRLAGGLGPLQAMGASGTMTFDFKADGANTRLTVTYVVSGFAAGQGFATLGPAVDAVLTQQVSRFTHFVETGKPVL